ncbi:MULTISPECIES: DAK2 domain-containing protein [Eubacteriales]|uniref:DAK2 domain-containing protein n=1 Tax=Eubacteriales TaxID=186802 RepID=UPI001B670F76|nr:MULTISPECIES: DAK2 domain-containing protein [Eubacteriales]MBP8858548.1 DAK2 domain-containing protein [Lawsonibacter sp.]MBS5504769.1 DAK2 domain-containing protein [Oscillospiraceae bacterium]MCB5925154.1 DAK2 domain-containing protein [bacterium 210820-DFI.5.26]MEE0111948.1 DAK2 domain-containing protein [Eubacteriales bacterium]MCQ5158089.1 DAK2 domain-containing protein [Clostridium sp. DFI.5.61]
MTQTIDAAAFQQMVIHAAAAISAQKQHINDLNVFPVPDGDTGTNMSLTISAAAAELKKKQCATVGEAAQTAASALLRGARGNSGVILSLLFRGIAKSLKDRETIDGRDLAIALDFGVAAAYKAVMKPAEGTILTVSRLAAAQAAAAAREENAAESVLEAAIREGQEALADTINQNPVLKKAGVVDAGGKGFLVILQGMLDSLRGEPMPQVEEESAPADKADFVAMAAEDITFAFDTVFIVRKHTEEVDLEPFRTYLNSIGDSLVIGEDDTAFKVHVHTNTPGAALTESQKYGTLELAKIENMRTQADDLAAGKHVQSTDDLEAVEAELEAGADGGAPVKAAPEKKYGFVAVCAGQGLEAVFRDLGVDGVISGGQTMNPSTEDILREVDKTPAEIVYVLPNNKNIIMAAEQCVRLCEDKRVVVLPSKTVPQGISAMLAVDLDAQEEDNTQAMTEALQNVHTAEVTYAARDSDFGGFTIKQGDYLALEEHQLFGTDQDLDTLLTRLAQAPEHQDAGFITIFYGEDVTEEQAQKAADIFTEACPSAEINLLPGGQPVYYYMISAE